MQSDDLCCDTPHNHHHSPYNMSDKAALHPSRPPFWRVWLTAARPHTLTASVSPVLVGYFSTLAYGGVDHSSSSSSLSLLSSLSWKWLCFCLLIQLGTNLHNDYADYVLGADDEKRMGQARATQKKWVTPFQMASAATSCLTVALMIGLSLIWQVSSSTKASSSASMPTIPIMWFVVLSSIFNAFAYTGGNCYPFSYLGPLRYWSIGYSGMGDIMCFLYFGLVATLMIPFMWRSIHANTTTSSSSSSFHASAWTLWWILACQVGCFATAILVVNNVRDRHTDAVAHKRTTTVRFGVVFARVEYAVLLLTPYMLVLYTKGQQHNDHDFMLLPLMTLPLLRSQLQAVSGAEVDGPNLNPHVGGTAKIQFFFCILQAISLYLYYQKQQQQ